jgi:hypothetical protein
MTTTTTTMMVMMMMMMMMNMMVMMMMTTLQGRNVGQPTKIIVPLICQRCSGHSQPSDRHVTRSCVTRGSGGRRGSLPSRSGRMT